MGDIEFAFFFDFVLIRFWDCPDSPTPGGPGYSFGTVPTVGYSLFLILFLFAIYPNEHSTFLGNAR